MYTGEIVTAVSSIVTFLVLYTTSTTQVSSFSGVILLHKYFLTSRNPHHNSLQYLFFIILQLAHQFTSNAKTVYCCTVKTINKIKIISIQFNLWHVLVFHRPSSGSILNFQNQQHRWWVSGNLTTAHRLEQNWHYTYAVGCKVQDAPWGWSMKNRNMLELTLYLHHFYSAYWSYQAPSYE